MRTLLTIADQKNFICRNYNRVNFEHKWSARGCGNSKLLGTDGVVLAKASGCGYDRFGTVLGELICELFPAEVAKLAEKTRNKKARKTYQPSKDFYGLFYNFETKKAWLDGGCGESCMKRVLNKIGFTLEYLNETSGSVSGSQFYRIVPITKSNRKYFN